MNVACLTKKKDWGGNCMFMKLIKPGSGAVMSCLSWLGRPGFVWINNRDSAVECQTLTPDRNQRRTLWCLWCCSNNVADKTSHAAKVVFPLFFSFPFLVFAHKSYFWFQLSPEMKVDKHLHSVILSQEPEEAIIICKPPQSIIFKSLVIRRGGNRANLPGLKPMINMIRLCLASHFIAL